MTQTVTAIVPCLNESDHIEPCLNSIAAFDVPEGFDLQVLILEGGSTDGTRAKVEAFCSQEPRFRMIENPGRIQSTAMNIGVREASGAWIMRLDAHSHYPEDYLRVCLEMAERTGAYNVGGVFLTLPGDDSYQAHMVQALTTHRFGVGDSGFRTSVSEGPVDTVPYGFFPRQLFDRIGWFDERLVRCQDYEFNRRIAALGGVTWCQPALAIRYHNQRSFWGFLRKQFLLEAPYNAYMWFLAPYAFALRHAVTAAFAAGFVGGVILGPLTRWITYPFVAVMILYALLALVSSVQQAIRYRHPRHLFALPPAFFLYHLVHGFGVWNGLIHLMLGRAPVQKTREPWPGAGRRRAWPRD